MVKRYFFILITAFLLLLMVLDGGGGKSPEGGGRSGTGIKPPPGIYISPEVFKSVKETNRKAGFKGIILHYGGKWSGKSFERALACFDIVLAVPGENGARPRLSFGKRWKKDPGGGSGELHVIWIGRDSPRSRAMLVKFLEGALTELGLSRNRLRLHGELPWATSCIGPAGNKCFLQPMDGDLLRSWIRGTGAGHKKKPR